MSKSHNINDGKWAFFVSLLSIVFSFSTAIFVGFQAWYANNQLLFTTKPLINFDVEEDPKEPPLGIVIANDGMGPAIIKSLTYYVDKKQIGNWEDVEKYSKIDENKIIYYDLEEDYSMAANSKFWLIKYKKGGKENSDEIDRFVDFLDQHIAVKTTYCSAHNDCWTKCSTKNHCNE